MMLNGPELDSVKPRSRTQSTGKVFPGKISHRISKTVVAVDIPGIGPVQFRLPKSQWSARVGDMVNVRGDRVVDILTEHEQPTWSVPVGTNLSTYSVSTAPTGSAPTVPTNSIPSVSTGNFSPVESGADFNTLRIRVNSLSARMNEVVDQAGPVRSILGATSSSGLRDVASQLRTWNSSLQGATGQQLAMLATWLKTVAPDEGISGG